LRIKYQEENKNPKLSNELYRVNSVDYSKFKYLPVEAKDTQRIEKYFHNIISEEGLDYFHQYDWPAKKDTSHVFRMSKPAVLSYIDNYLRNSSSNFKIIHQVKRKDEFTTWGFTIKNNHKEPVIINKVEFFIATYHWYAGGAKTRELKAIALWDVTLPSTPGLYSFEPQDPILIDSQDAATIDIRFGGIDNVGKSDNYGKRVPLGEAGIFIVRVEFYNDKNERAGSNFLLFQS